MRLYHAKRARRPSGRTGETCYSDRMRRLFCAVIVAALATACGRREPPPREFEIVGQIQAAAGARDTVTIAHEDIQGFMPGMTMTFKVKDPSVLSGTEPGDLVKGTLVVGEVEVHISKLAKTGHQDLKQSAPPADGAAILQPGDAVKVGVLLDQDGATRRISDWRGHRVALTFVYTRCPLPEFCPLMNKQFAAVQKTLKGNAALKDVHLLTMSLDPEFDTPQVLKPYAAGAGADPAVWTFLTASPEEAARFSEQFGLIVERDPSSAVQITHNLRTAIIGADGRLAAMHTGNHWTPDELVADLTASPAPAH
jgi:protein SCO1/2